MLPDASLTFSGFVLSKSAWIVSNASTTSWTSRISWFVIESVVISTDSVFSAINSSIRLTLVTESVDSSFAALSLLVTTKLLTKLWKKLPR